MTSSYEPEEQAFTKPVVPCAKCNIQQVCVDDGDAGLCEYCAPAFFKRRLLLAEKETRVNTILENLKWWIIKG